jgi:hypothetical protein
LSLCFRICRAAAPISLPPIPNPTGQTALVGRVLTIPSCFFCPISTAFEIPSTATNQRSG